MVIVHQVGLPPHRTGGNLAGTLQTKNIKVGPFSSSSSLPPPTTLSLPFVTPASKGNHGNNSASAERSNSSQERRIGSAYYLKAEV